MQPPQTRSALEGDNPDPWRGAHDHPSPEWDYRTSISQGRGSTDALGNIHRWQEVPRRPRATRLRGRSAGGNIHRWQEAPRRPRATRLHGRSAGGKSQGIMSSHPGQAACWPCDGDSHFPSWDTGFCMRSYPPSSAVCKPGASVLRWQAKQAMLPGSFLPSPRTRRSESRCPPAEPHAGLSP